MIFLGDERHRNLFDAMIATMPIITFLVFGLQTVRIPDVPICAILMYLYQDILHAWCFWRRPAESNPEDIPVTSEPIKGVQSV
jgi:hypothetical protein